MEPYEELGVAPTATREQIHAAYVDLARRHHPDRAGDAAGQNDRMARINAAWEVLRDPESRAALDAARPQRQRSHVRQAADTWTPLDDDGADVADLDDTPTGARQLPRLVTLVPATLFVAGVILAMSGLIVDVGAAVGLGAAAILAAGGAFVAIPVVTMIAASRAERDW